MAKMSNGYEKNEKVVPLVALEAERNKRQQREYTIKELQLEKNQLSQKITKAKYLIRKAQKDQSRNLSKVLDNILQVLEGPPQMKI